MIVRSNCKQYLNEFAVSAKMILDSHQKQNHRNEGASGSAADLLDVAELVQQKNSERHEQNKMTLQPAIVTTPEYKEIYSPLDRSNDCPVLVS